MKSQPVIELFGLVGVALLLSNLLHRYTKPDSGGNISTKRAAALEGEWVG